MQRKINVTIRDKIAVAEKDALYICGNSDFAIVFDFDDEWAGYDYKTARFVFNDTFADVVFSGNECAIPVLSNTYNFIVGVFAGDLHTTTPAYVGAKKSILCDAGMPSEPFDDAYAQLIEIFNHTMVKVDAIPEEAYKARDDAKASAEAAAKSEANAEDYWAMSGNNASTAVSNAGLAKRYAEEAEASKEAAAASAKEVSDKAPIASPVFTGSISLGRRGGTDVGYGSVAIGSSVEASGVNSHAEGFDTTAKGDYSHTEGRGTRADSEYQHVQGRFNIEDPDGKYVHIVGNGTHNDSFNSWRRSNAHTLDWDGNAWFAGTVEGTALILLSPGGKRFKITVDDNGTLSTAEVTE